ncbi:MAG: demethoxyubiquinone hydroxylase family protein [Holosporaceae bacterium]|nr:MAG: demethoxyubiquinone hydroxylase family protein [Holosporaceae bacterium]
MHLPCSSHAVCSFYFLVSFGLSAYHVMIEYGIIPLPDFCKTDLLKATSFEELKAQIMNTKKLVPCNAASAKVLFLTLAEWNTIISFLLLISAWLFKEKMKKSDVKSCLRVDHAGELAATKIYEGQLSILSRSSVASTIKEMHRQETQHLSLFENALKTTETPFPFKSFLGKSSLRPWRYNGLNG